MTTPLITAPASASDSLTRSLAVSSRLAFIAAPVLFAISLALPAYDTPSYKGWECAKHVFGVLTELPTEGYLGWLYYACFNVTNLTLILLPLLSFTPLGRYGAKRVCWLAGTCVLHTYSWLGYAILRNAFNDLKVGYYVWLLATMTLFAACLLRVHAQRRRDAAAPLPPHAH